MAKWKRVRASNMNAPKAEASASTGFTLSNLGASSVVSILDFLPVQRIRFEVRQQTNSIAADAAEAFGIALGTLPETEMLVLASKMTVNMLTPTGLTSTAGEMGLGTVIATGAVAVLSGTATFENIATGQTLSNLVAGTNLDCDFTVAGPTIVDATNGTTKAHLNIASTWDQTAAENLTVDGTVDIWYIDLGDF